MKNKLLYFGNCSAFEKTKLSNPSLGVGGAGTQQGAPLKLWFPPPSTPPALCSTCSPGAFCTVRDQSQQLLPGLGVPQLPGQGQSSRAFCCVFLSFEEAVFLAGLKSELL